MLQIRDLDVAYDRYQVLWDVSIRVDEGEIVCLLGPNGAGKSSLMNAISGLVRPKAGSVTFCGERIDHQPAHKIVSLGLSHVLERRRLFPYLTVWENLTLGAYNPRARLHRQETLDWVLSLFPLLEVRRRQVASTLSGGEQQLVALARGLMSRPKLLMMDEPLLGLSPVAMAQISKAILGLRKENVTLLFIEQNVEQALELADRAYVLESGRISLSGTAQELMGNSRVREVYLGA